MDLNKVTLIGHVVRDPEERALAKGQTLTRYSLATNYAWQDAASKARRETVEYHDCVAWGKLGQIVAEYIKKGSKIYVEGRLRSRSFTGKDGLKRTRAEVVTENMIMLGHKTPAKAASALAPEEPSADE
jgi:single-strand DNA-binding protein